MFKISLKPKRSFKSTKGSDVTAMFVRRVHLFGFPGAVLHRRDGNRCSRINEAKMTGNHPHFSCIDALTSTVTRKIGNSNLSQEITDTLL